MDENLLLSLLLTFVAAALNGTMDVIDFRFDKSVFANVKNMDLYCWLRSDPAYEKKRWKGIPLHPIFWDGWHCAKNLLVVVMIINIVFIKFYIALSLGSAIIYFFLYGIVWYAGFTLFFKKLLLSDK